MMVFHCELYTHLKAEAGAGVENWTAFMISFTTTAVYLCSVIA
jgi:hypothetical protein